MAGPVYGSVEHYIANGFSSGSTQAMFVSLYNFLNTATSIGVQRIAYHTGAQGTGMTKVRDMGYFDATNPAGENAFACFRFLSASVPFDMLIQWSAGTSINTAPGAPAQIDAGNGGNTIGIAICQRTDGSSSWGGTTLNNGNDSKSTPVWSTGSTSAAFYPRSNDPIRRGSHGTSKQNMMGIYANSDAKYRWHMVADYDNFVMLTDYGADNSYYLFFFGVYTPISGLNPTIPYFGFSDQNYSYPNPASSYGPVAGSTPAGGISFPDVAGSGTCIFGPDYVSTFYTRASTTYQPNKVWGTARWDESPFWVGCVETPNQVGLCGQHSTFMRTVYNIATHDTNSDGSRAVFGDTTLASYKVTIPFHTGTVPGSGLTKEGVYFGATGAG